MVREVFRVDSWSISGVLTPLLRDHGA